MSIKIGISGFGRIARLAVRAAEDMPDFELVGINKRNANIDYMRYMLQYDSVFGPFKGTVDTYEDGLVINGRKVPVYGANDIKDIPWSECGAEYILEATGAFRTIEKAAPHITSGGAKKVILTAPGKGGDIPTFVYDVNTDEYTADMKIVSNASCTTNCLAPICKVLNDKFGIEEGLMSTIHAATAKQNVVDAKNEKDWRRGRSVFGNIIPTTTGAAKAVGLVIPELQGKLTGIAYRIPAADGSIVDFNVRLSKSTTYEEICEAMKEASEGELKNSLKYVDDEVVSSDFIGEELSSIFDKRAGFGLNDRTFKIVAYYDNEYGYTCKTLDLVRHMYEVDHAE